MAQQDLILARQQIDNLIVQITASPNPDYSIDGKSVSKAGYLRELMAQRKAIEELIMMADGPYEIRTQGF